MEADEWIHDVVRSTETEYQSRWCDLHRLESADKVGREADQCVITIVESTEDQSSDKRLQDQITRASLS